MQNIRPAVAMAAAIIFLLAACGGASADSQPTSSQTSATTARIEDNGTPLTAENSIADHTVEDQDETPVEGVTSMPVTLGDTRLLYEGPCSVRDGALEFTSVTDPTMGWVKVSVEPLPDGSHDVTVNLSIPVGDYAGEWTMHDASNADSPLELRIGEKSFNVNGIMTGPDGATEVGVMGMACDA